MERLGRKVKSGDKEAKAEYDVLVKLQEALENEKPARSLELTEDEKKLVKHFHLLTMKPVLYVTNVSEDGIHEAENGQNPYVEKVREFARAEGSGVVIISAKVESEIAEMEEEDKAMFLEELGLQESGLDRLIREAYTLLGLITYFTAGVQEVRAWTIRRGTKAPQAAAVIHNDFERGFIRAEVVAYDDLVAAGSMAKAKENGKFRLEGKEYVVADGDIMHFRFNV